MASMSFDASRLSNPDIDIVVRQAHEYDGSLYYELELVRRCETFQKLGRRRFHEQPTLRTYCGPEHLDYVQVIP